MRTLLVEADGGSRGNPGPAGYGAVVRDAADRQVLVETAEYIGTATNNVAEYRGLIAGLRAARSIAPDAAVEVRMDSKLVVEQMSGRWKIKHPDMRPLAAEAAEVFPAGQVRYSWIPREKNRHADRLANEAMDAGREGRQWEPSASSVVADDPPPAPSAAALALGEAGPPTVFVLLRHGETGLTAERRFSGSGGPDPELTERGRWQAQRAAEVLAARGTVQAVVSSPLARCRETARIAADRIGLEVRVDDGLRETDFGSWEGLSFAEVRERYPDDLEAWLASPQTAPTGGESLAAVARRVALSRDKLLARYSGRTVLVVSHATPIKTLTRLCLGAPPESVLHMDLSPASLSAIHYHPDGNATLRLLNETTHLTSGRG